MTYWGEVRGGVVVLPEGVHLPDGAQVQITLVAQPLAGDRISSDADLDPVFRMDELAADTGIPDLATNIDHYLYGRSADPVR